MLFLTADAMRGVADVLDQMNSLDFQDSEDAALVATGTPIDINGMHIGTVLFSENAGWVFVPAQPSLDLLEAARD